MVTDEDTKAYDDFLYDPPEFPEDPEADDLPDIPPEFPAIRSALIPWTNNPDGAGLNVWSRQSWQVLASAIQYERGDPWFWSVTDHHFTPPEVIAGGHADTLELAKLAADSAVEDDLNSIIPHEETHG